MKNTIVSFVSLFLVGCNVDLPTQTMTNTTDNNVAIVKLESQELGFNFGVNSKGENLNRWVKGLTTDKNVTIEPGFHEGNLGVDVSFEALDGESTVEIYYAGNKVIEKSCFSDLPFPCTVYVPSFPQEAGVIVINKETGNMVRKILLSTGRGLLEKEDKTSDNFN